LPGRAIYYEDDLPEELEPHLADNAAFFAETLPGKDAQLGSPGGTATIGPLYVCELLGTSGGPQPRGDDVEGA
jgi:hypothetical protein